MTNDRETLAAEGRAFARYLVGGIPSGDLVQRYVDASRVLFDPPTDDRDRALLGFVRRHPWSAGHLDAAAALLLPAGQLRGRILVMAAILEASPAHADAFLPCALPLPRLVTRLGLAGARAMARAAIGLVLYAVATRTAA